MKRCVLPEAQRQPADGGKKYMNYWTSPEQFCTMNHAPCAQFIMEAQVMFERAAERQKGKRKFGSQNETSPTAKKTTRICDTSG